MSYGITYDKHLVVREPISAHDVAVATGWNNVINGVSNRIVDPITPKSFSGATVNTACGKDVLQDEILGQITHKPFRFVNALIRLKQERGAPGWCCCPPFLPGAENRALFGRHIFVTLRPAISALFPLAHAGLALIRQAKLASRVLIKEFACRRKLSVAPKADPMAVIGFVVMSHSRTIPYGPHFQLPWELYP